MEPPRGKNQRQEEELHTTVFYFPPAVEDITILNGIMENREDEGVSGTLTLHPNKLILTLDGHEPLELSEGDIIALIRTFEHVLEHRAHIVRAYCNLRDLLGPKMAAATLRDNYLKDPLDIPTRR